MRILRFIFSIVIIISTTACSQKKTPNTVAKNHLQNVREYYQLREYTFNSDEQEKTTDQFLKRAFIPALKKLDIQNIGVFKIRPEKTDSIKKIIVLIPFSSIQKFLSLEKDLAKDTLYLNAGNEYLNANYLKPPYKRMASTLMKAFKDMPMMKPSILNGPKEDRVYELRSYESPTEKYFINKLEMFNAGGEIKLFEKLEFNAVFYGEVISGAKMPNLMYMTTFENQKSRDEHWKAFVDSPEWKKLSTMPKYQNNVSNITINFLYPTEYSDY